MWCTFNWLLHKYFSSVCMYFFLPKIVVFRKCAWKSFLLPSMLIINNKTKKTTAVHSSVQNILNLLKEAEKNGKSNSKKKCTVLFGSVAARNFIGSLLGNSKYIFYFLTLWGCWIFLLEEGEKILDSEGAALSNLWRVRGDSANWGCWIFDSS